ncbi:MAG TPA: universal stress protein [Gemmatimonadaceae bacterium]|nr:universal stress protein [Gemmatimonadaceae bacterium]
MVLQRVVVGVDFSAPSEAAVRWTARELAPNAELVLVHAVDVPEPPSFLRGRFPPRETLTGTARTGADRSLRELSATLGVQRIWLEVREGRADEVIAAVAGEYRADLVVTGAHGERGGVFKQLGSTAERVARAAPAPVLLAREPLPASRATVLVAMDDDGLTPALQQWTTFLAAQFDAAVTGLHVVSETMLGRLVSLAAVVVGTPEPPALGVGVVEDANVWMRELVAKGLDSTRTRGEVAYGDPAREILAAAERISANLIVLGRHRASGVRRQLLGSVADRVVRGTSCSVLVVTEAASDAASAGEERPAA